MLDMRTIFGQFEPVNKLTPQERARILQPLCEGKSIRAVARVTGTSKNTVARLLNDAGVALGAYQDRVFRDLQCERVQVDDIWSFTYAKQKNVAKTVATLEGASDTWTWTAICGDSKLVLSWLVGSRDAGSAYEFIKDVYGRLANRIQLTSDGLNGYTNVVRDIFGMDVDFAQLVKVYGEAGETFKGRYGLSPTLAPGKTRIEGRADSAYVSKSYFERQNLAMRMHMRRLKRLPNDFSKKVETHANAVAFHFACYNFVRIHKSLRATPAMTAGVTDRLWEMADLVKVLEDAEAATAPKKRGLYKKGGNLN